MIEFRPGCPFETGKNPKFLLKYAFVRSSFLRSGFILLVKFDD